MRSNDILSLVMSSARPVQRELLRSRRIRTQRTPSGLRHAENVFRMLVVGFFPFRHIDVQGIHRSLEGLWAAHGARQFRTAEYVENWSVRNSVPSRPSTSKPPMRTLAISRIWVNLPPARSTSSLMRLDGSHAVRPAL